METIRDIFMNATDEDLSVLAGYSTDIANKAINTGNDMTKRYLCVNELVASFQTLGRTFFYSKMEYGDVVRKLAESMEVNIDKKSYVGIDVVELAIAKKYIINNLQYIPNDQKTELIKILGFTSLEVDIDYKNVIIRLCDDLSDMIDFRLLTWLANATVESFVGNTREWDSEGIKFFGRQDFRQHVIYPIIYVTMLRHKYRYSQVPKCSACKAVIVPGAKFCNECGTKLN